MARVISHNALIGMADIGSTGISIGITDCLLVQRHRYR
ncbi:hypothetical protein OCAR_7730 [Afipia carboxidovorans OM5]|nr:hypothetical protein OCAR_7730 [Afipia carboxidovorans OM5]